MIWLCVHEIAHMSIYKTLELLQNNYPGAIFLNFIQCALALSITTQTLRVGICTKKIKLKTIKVGGRRLVHINDLANYIDEITSKATAPKKRGRPRNVVIVGGAL